jgi:hypothetical protein
MQHKALMIQGNALIPFKLAARLCGIPKQEILKRAIKFLKNTRNSNPAPATINTSRNVREDF